MSSDENIEKFTEEFYEFSETKEARTFCFGNYNNASRDESIGLYCYLAARKKAQKDIDHHKSEASKWYREWYNLEVKSTKEIEKYKDEITELRKLVNEACTIMINDYDDDYVNNVEAFCKKAEKYKQGSEG